MSRVTSIALLVVIMAAGFGCTNPQRVSRDEDKPYNLVITTRDHWPEGIPLRIHLRYDGPWFRYAGVRSEVKPTYPGAKEARCYTLPSMILATIIPDYGDHTQDVGTPPASTEGVSFAARIRRTDLPFEPTLWRETIHHPVRIEGTVDDVLTPVRDAELDRLLAEESNLRVTSVTTRGDQLRAEVSLADLAPGLLEDPGLTFAVAIELLRDGRPVASAEGWWGSSILKCGAPWFRRGHLSGYQSIVLTGRAGLLAGLDSSDSTWQLRVRSNPLMALRDFQNDRYWSGEILLPLDFPDNRPLNRMRAKLHRSGSASPE